MRNNIIDISIGENDGSNVVTLAEAKAQLIVTFSDDDAYISNLIQNASRAVENYCYISFGTKSVILTVDVANEFELPYGPVQEITTVQTRATASGSGPVSYQDATNWQVDGVLFKRFSGTNFGTETLFNTRLDRYPTTCNFTRFKIEYVAGYGNAVNTPNDLKQAILIEIAAMYENRGDNLGKLTSFEAQALCQPHIRQSWQ